VKTLLLISALALPASAAEPTEKEVLEYAIEIAREGGLGFELPQGWQYFFDDKYGGCARFGMSEGCIPVADEEPIEADDYIQPVWALTSRSANQTTFFRDSAAPNPKMEIMYMSPDQDPDIPSVTFVQPQPFTALEMAAYVLGHEVDGHLNHQDGGWSDQEMQANYYGLQAVKALRAYLAAKG